MLDAPVPLVLIAGYTGSRKTEVLRELSRLGKQTIDLERLADHRGSVFGDIGCGTQPSFGQFANMLCGRLRSTNTKQPVFIEAKGEKLGSVVIPPPIFKKMKSCTSITLAVPASRRLDTVRSRYRNADMDDLCRRIIKIHRWLGTTAAKSAIGALNAGDVHAALEILMRYYDGVYDSAWGGRAGPTFYSRTGDPAELAEKILLTLTDTDIRPV